jgi:hypothetical protein
LEDILYRLPKKRLLELRLYRTNRLIEEQKNMEDNLKKKESEAIRQRILKP